MFHTCCCSSDASDVKELVECQTQPLKEDILPASRRLEENEAQLFLDGPLLILDVVDGDVSPSCLDDVLGPAVAEIAHADIVGEIHEALVKQLLLPALQSDTGWPISQILLHGMEIKKGLANTSQAGKREVLAWLFGLTRAPYTHRLLAMDFSDREADISEQRLVLNTEELASLQEVWRSKRRKEAAGKGTPLAPGREFQRWMMGIGNGLPERPMATTDVHVHILGPSSPQWFDSFLNFFQQLIVAAHKANNRSVERIGSAQLAALAGLLPLSTGVLQDLLCTEESRYHIAEESGAPGVLRHHLKVYWNIEGIEKRFGADQRDLFRDRPMYTLFIEEEAIGEASNDSKRVALKIIEGHNNTVDFTFFSVPSGGLVWMTADTKPLMNGGQPAVVPGLVGSSVRMHLTDAKLPIGACHCMLQYLSLPDMVFSMDVVRNPYPIVSFRCLELAAFPLEWFYRPLFSGLHMRLLLVRFFTHEFHFIDDEIHVHLAFQIPRFGSLLKTVLKAFSTMLMGAIFSPPDKDPIPILLQAFGSDCAALESGIHARYKVSL